MAAEGELEKEVITHRRGYDGFIALMKWGAIISIVTALLVVFIISE